MCQDNIDALIRQHRVGRSSIARTNIVQNSFYPRNLHKTAIVPKKVNQVQSKVVLLNVKIMNLRMLIKSLINMSNSVIVVKHQ